ncbi:MAG TPA: hypothetical protein VGG34_01150 [Opitutaceae bacterium]|jgi:hypothetical protein
MTTLRKFSTLVLLLVAVFAVDWYTDQLNVGPLYLLLVVYARWQMGLGTGIATAFACPFLWAWADYGTGHRFSHEWILYENIVVRIFTYSLIVAGVSIYKRSLEAHRRRLAMLERLLSVCPGCGAIGVTESGWRKPAEFHAETTHVYTLCPTCAAAHPIDVPQNPPRPPAG